MINFIFGSLARRLAVFFLTGAVLIIFTGSFLSFNYSKQALEKEIFNHLTSVTEIRKENFLQYLKERIGDITILAQSSDTKNAFKDLNNYYDLQGALPDRSFNIDSEQYKAIYNKIDPFFRKYTEKYGYYDLFMICKEHSHIMYTVTQEKDLGTALKSGLYKDSGLGKLFLAVLKENKTIIKDFSLYAPSGQPGAFIGTPVSDYNGDVYGVLAFQLSTKKINDLMHDTAGMGKTGETLLVGQDLLMRTDSRFENDSTILKKKIDTVPVRNSLKHQAGSGIIIDYRGVEVLSSYTDVGLNEELGTGFEWAIISKIDKSEAFAPIHELFSGTVKIGLLLALAASIAGYILARSIAGPLEKLSKAAASMADGDLTVEISPVKRFDEVGLLWNSFNNLAVNLQKQIYEITEGANVLAASACEISTSVSQLSSSAAESAAAVNQTTTTVEEVRQTALVSSQKAKTVSEGAQAAARTSQTGMEFTENSVKGMSRIKKQMRFIADSSVKLSEQGQTISGIIDTVADLAEQSNLLAVNAAIEAVKAGDHGKGFSVVAQEIRRLAEQSKQATIQVRTILNDIQKAVTTTVMATEQGEKAVGSGEEQTTLAGNAIRELSKNVTEAAQAAVQIAASSQQQLVGVDQVASAMENINQASAQNLDGSRQLEESAKNLNDLGQRLKELVSQYNIESVRK
ncbi:methyl-accepting chemotaxis protein [Desulfobacterales bacterium HSG17]|nr:methyl-accepting chemotaxis protein [Desulfobacterales bacterium HSG17]